MSQITSNLKTASEKIHDLVQGFTLPTIGLVLGSGLSSIAQEITDSQLIPYSEIPFFHRTTTQGHPGGLILGKIQGVSVACLRGRFHYYEGISMEQVTFPVRLLCTLGIRTLILVSAVGAINTRYRPGELMLIEDHLNFVGTNPLIGPNEETLGPRFPDMSQAYRRDSLNILQRSSKELGLSVHTGIYAGVCGPSYETPAEIRMLRTFGADVVGMSTVAECIAANHMGTRVAGVCCISNLAAGLSSQPLAHADVLEVARLGSEKIKALLTQSISDLAELE